MHPVKCFTVSWWQFLHLFLDINPYYSYHIMWATALSIKNTKLKGSIHLWKIFFSSSYGLFWSHYLRQNIFVKLKLPTVVHQSRKLEYFIILNYKTKDLQVETNSWIYTFPILNRCIVWWCGTLTIITKYTVFHGNITSYVHNHILIWTRYQKLNFLNHYLPRW